MTPHEAMATALARHAVAHVGHRAEQARVRAVQETGRVADMTALFARLDEMLQAGEDHRRAWEAHLEAP